MAKNCETCRHIELIADCDSDGHITSGSGYTCNKRAEAVAGGAIEKRFLARLDDAWWISIKHPFGETNHLCTQARDEQFAELIAAPQPSDNLQQASTDDEPEQCPKCAGSRVLGEVRGVRCRNCDGRGYVQASTAQAEPAKTPYTDKCGVSWESKEAYDRAVSKEAASDTDAGTRYQVREIGEGGWRDASKEWYEYCQKSPEMDTRIAAPAQATPEGADLPPLPAKRYSATTCTLFTADQMRDFYRQGHASGLEKAAEIIQNLSSENEDGDAALNRANTAILQALDAEPVDQKGVCDGSL